MSSSPSGASSKGLAVEANSIRGKTVTLKVKWADFTQITRSKTTAQPLANAAEISGIVEQLLTPIFPVPKGIRLLGVTLSSLDQANEDKPQLVLAL
ncbi:impB/mucB/samB family protein [Sinorhizobium americanum]|uniref:ImpB/mucB/samB family protein n=1 Tax=Sinorhizobium americanum TaxID=194963 RepID=A0A4R2BIG6_9HYPH|nr:impB/mucB/samB family protein [Sinorhizobium americanum]